MWCRYAHISLDERVMHACQRKQILYVRENFTNSHSLSKRNLWGERQNLRVKEKLKFTLRWITVLKLSRGTVLGSSERHRSI